MKKLVLATVAAFSLLTANAQNLTLFGPDGSGPYGVPYTYGGSSFAAATVGGVAVYSITGLGTMGNGIPAMGSGYTAIPYNGTASNFIFSFDLIWDGFTSLQIDFKTTTSTSNFRASTVSLPSSSSSAFATITIPASSILCCWGGGPASLGDGDVKTLTELQITANGATASSYYAIGNIKIIDRSVVTSYNNTNVSSSVAVVPNPSSEGYINVNTDLNVTNIAVMNAQGAFVNASVNGNRVNTATLAPGVYTLLIDTEKGRTAKKVVVE